MSGATVSISKKWSDGTLVSIGGVGSQDFLQNLAAFVETDVADHIVKAIGDSLTPSSTPDAQQTLHDAGFRQQPAPPAPRPAASGQPGGQPPLCEHGHAREFKSGTGKNNKPWKAWMCPLDRSEACEPQWLR